MSAASRAVYDAAWSLLFEMASKVDPAQPWRAPDAAALDRVTFDSWLTVHVPDARARWALLFDVVVAWAVPPWRLSLLHALQTLAAFGGCEGADWPDPMRIVDGGEGVCRIMANDLGERLHLSAPVDLADWNAAGVTVHARGLVVEARQCIVAMSPSDAHRIRFTPCLPWAREMFHRQSQMGGGVMTALVYDSPFWREEGLSGEAATDLPAGAHLNDNSPRNSGLGVINSFVTPLPSGMPWGSPRDALDTPDLRRRAVTAAAVAAFGRRAEHAIGYVEKDWMNERFIAGVQGAWPPGLLTEVGSAMQSAVGPLRWCSAEHGVRWTLTMDGAIESGQRVAADVLGTL